MSGTLFRWVFVICLVFMGASKTSATKRMTGKNSARASISFKHKNTKKNLIALFQLLWTYQKRGETAKAARLTRAMLPDKRRLRKALSKRASSGVRAKILGMYKRFTSRSDAFMARLIRRKKGQTRAKAYGARGSEIAKNRHGSVVYKEFPGGAVRAAKMFLRPQTTFYEVEFLKPGKKRGMKYHLLFWDGKQSGEPAGIETRAKALI